MYLFLINILIAFGDCVWTACVSGPLRASLWPEHDRFGTRGYLIYRVPVGFRKMFFLFGGSMARPLKRFGVHKGRSAARFRSNTRKAKAPNVVVAPMRGGWRL